MRTGIKKFYSSLLSNQRNRKLDQEMLALSYSLSTEQLQSCRVYPDRRSLIATFPQNAVVVEVGVARGDFSVDILNISQPSMLFLIDAWNMDHPDYGENGYKKVKERFDREIESGRVQIRRGLSIEKLAEFDDCSLDWIYIDAAHDYLSVKQDLNLAFGKIKSGGVISGHDYHRWGKHGKRFGVLEAVNEFCVQKKLLFVGLSLENNLNWSYALKVVK